MCRLGRGCFDGGWAKEDAVDQIGDIFWWDSVEKKHLLAQLQHPRLLGSGMLILVRLQVRGVENTGTSVFVFSLFIFCCSPWFWLCGDILLVWGGFVMVW